MKNKNYLRITYILLTLIVTITTLYSNDEAEKNPNYYASRAQALNAASEATAAKYPDADSVLLEEATKIEYAKDGTNAQWQEAYIKILTEKGRKEHLTVSSYYTIPYQNEEDCRVDLIEIIHEDGSSEIIDIAKESSTSTNNSGMESNIYNPDQKVITVNVSNLKINDILHYKMFDRKVLPLAQGIYEDAFSFENTTPIIEKKLTITGPKSFPLKKKIICDEIPGTIKFSEHENDNQITYIWTGKNIPQAIPEPNMPSLFSCTQRLLVCTSSSWEDVSRWYWNLSEKALNDTSESMKKKVADLTDGAQTTEEKISRIFRYVSQDIRYMGITTEKVSPGREPHPVSQTFEAQYGVCRDKAALLTAMLRIAGIEAFPVLIHNGDLKDQEVPNTFFNHAITAARVDGKYILMDSTDENTQELLPSYLNNKSYIVATPQGETLQTTAVTPAQENMITIETTGELAENGTLQANSSIIFDGINDNVYRGYFSRITPEERKNYFQAVIRRVYGSGTILDCQITPEQILDTNQKLKVEISYKAENILARGKDLALMPAPFISKNIGLVNNIFYDAKLEKRRFPLQLGFTAGVRENTKISLSPEIRKIITLPIYRPIESEDIEWKRSLAEVKNNLIGTNEFLINTLKFSTDQYNELKKSLRAIEYNSRKKAVLAVKEEATKITKKVQNSDIISNVNITYNILSANSWEVIEETKKRILNYAGKKDNSEIIINYNPSWEKVELIEATVTSKDGKMQTIDAREINTMDQSWNGLAPRYPGGKTLIASLPGVNIGSLIEYKIKYTYNNRPFFSMTEIFQDFNPLSKNITLKNSKNLLFQNLWNAPEYNYNTDNKQYNWSMSSNPIKKELFLAPASSFLPTVTASSGNWYDYSRTIKEKLLAASKDQPNAAAKARELTKGICDGMQQIRIIRDFIARNIRTAGPDFSGIPLSCITPADLTLADGYGNTTDSAILFYTMLEALGKKAEFYITTTYTAAEGLKTPILKNPQSSILENVLIRTEEDNHTIWLNDTTEYAQLGTTPSAGKIAFRLNNAEFTEIKVDPSAQTQEELFFFMDMSENSDAVINVFKEYSGASYEKNNKTFSEITPEEKKIFFQQELANIAQSAVADGELKTDFSRYPGQISYRAIVPKYSVIDNNYYYFNLPETLANLFSLRSASRENPLYLKKHISKKIHILIAIPKGFIIPEITPTNFKWVSPLYNGSIEAESILITPLALRSNSLGIYISKLKEYLIDTLQDSRNALYITINADIAPAFYPAALYSQVLEAQNKLSTPSAKEIMLTTSSNKKKE